MSTIYIILFSTLIAIAAILKFMHIGNADNAKRKQPNDQQKLPLEEDEEDLLSGMQTPFTKTKKPKKKHSKAKASKAAKASKEAAVINPEENEAAGIKLPKPEASAMQTAPDSANSDNDYSNTSATIIIYAAAMQGVFTGEALRALAQEEGLQLKDGALYKYAADGSVNFKMIEAAGLVDFRSIEKLNYQTQVVALVLKFDDSRNSVEAFLSMRQCAEHLATRLNATLKDTHYNVITEQTLKHYKKMAVQYYLKSQRQIV